MGPALLLAVLVAGLLALIPVWRLHRAGWSTSWLAAVWLGLALALVIVVELPPSARLLVPILVLAFIAPFVAWPERLTGMLRREPRGVVIDVTPRLGPRDPGASSDADANAGPAGNADAEGGDQPDDPRAG